MTKAKLIHKRQTNPLIRGCYIRTYDPKDSVAKHSLVVILEGLGAKTNRLAVNRQS
jgi:hypothetical protein